MVSLVYVDGLVQDCGNSSALALELPQFCSNISHQHMGDTIVSHYAIPMPQCSRTEGCAGLCSTVPTRPWEGTNLFGAPARVMPGVAKGTHSRRDFPLAFFIFNLEGHTSFNPNNKLITSYNVWLSLHNWLHLTWRVWRHDIKNMHWFLDELIRVFSNQ